MRSKSKVQTKKLEISQVVSPEGCLHIQLVLLHFTALGAEELAPALPKGASLMQTLIKVALDWNNFCPSGKHKGMKAGTLQSKKMAKSLKTIYPQSKTCSSLDFCHWLLKEIGNLLQGLRCILRITASMPKPVM